MLHKDLTISLIYSNPNWQDKGLLRILNLLDNIHSKCALNVDSQLRVEKIVVIFCFTCICVWSGKVTSAVYICIVSKYTYHDGSQDIIFFNKSFKFTTLLLGQPYGRW